MEEKNGTFLGDSSLSILTLLNLMKLKVKGKRFGIVVGETYMSRVDALALKPLVEKGI
ncbi:MAG: hypothetical protein PWP39_139 [Pyrococcus sp.]|uniref:hypothetical protein n=1 Tax=Pyrococcus sp. TaxID=33866 RepID=UPI0025894DFF|nr:hypothetical protein [Pyrococcus sp.]MDK2868904.1 hypothetical protein [Pyrococcus sp.]